MRRWTNRPRSTIDSTQAFPTVGLGACLRWGRIKYIPSTLPAAVRRASASPRFTSWSQSVSSFVDKRSDLGRSPLPAPLVWRAPAEWRGAVPCFFGGCLDGVASLAPAWRADGRGTSAAGARGPNTGAAPPPPGAAPPLTFVYKCASASWAWMAGGCTAAPVDTSEYTTSSDVGSGWWMGWTLRGPPMLTSVYVTPESSIVAPPMSTDEYTMPSSLFVPNGDV
mmetsp:Transcript_3441/g.8515  ORF Transcript_3441/g.8515 Transcript_3441/m.8515 type:complete len:223 (+) Transcript_3441:1374-2042(+)